MAATQALAGQNTPSFDSKRIYVSPNWQDLIVVELVSRSLEDYGGIAYGTPHPDAVLFPNHKAVFEFEQSKEIVVRYYAADRAGQDAYNYGISYAEESNAHPTYSRVYIVKRADYAAIAKLTADPINPTALLVKEDMVESTGDPRIDSLYVKVVRVYETLPGAILTEYDQEDETQVNVKTTYQVVANPVSAPSATNGILITYRKIDSVKSLKITRDFTAFLTFSFDEQKFGADDFPGLLDFTTYIYTDECGAFSQLIPRRSLKTQIRTHVTYTASKQTIAGLVLTPKSLMLGKGFQINQSVLVDDYTYTYTGTCSGTASGTGSDPTYTDYITTIQGTEQLVAGESVLWKAGIFRNTYVYEIML